MARDSSRLQNWLMYFSLQEREKRAYLRYKNERVLLETLAEGELIARYIDTKARYAHKRNMLLLFAVMVLMPNNLWSALYSVASMALPVMNVEPLHLEGIALEELAGVWLFLMLVLLAFIAALILIPLISGLAQLRSLHRRMLLLEEMKQMRSGCSLDI